MGRPATSVTCGKDWDVNGKAVLDGFSDAISAFIAGTFEGSIEVKSILEVVTPTDDRK
jgi:hypothetical protein